MSSTCPREQARTNRVATTGLLSNLAPIERGPPHHAAGTRAGLSRRAGVGFLHHEPLREPPRADTPLPILPVLRLRRGCVQPWIVHARHGGQLGRQARLFDRFQVGLGAPGVEPAHDRGFVWQVDQGSRPERGDDLAAPQLPVRLAVHFPLLLSRLERSCRNRFTCGSTSRSERLTRNFW